jgi:DNA mismatch repair protein MLH3
MSAPKILPLPPSITSHLLSTLTIPTLPTVLSELLQNSLDATATQITITANLRRHACAVSDNGYGILPESIPLAGEAYCTSKHALGKLGFRGLALAGIARHAVVTVVSRCEGYGQTYVRKLAFGRETHVGVEEDARLLHAGTAVRVEGLWADMPVRSAARPVDDVAVEREWEEVKGVVVRWIIGSGASVVVRDETGRRRMAISAVSEVAALRQVFGAEVHVDWERVRAKQGAMRVSGWMATTGSASKGFQYLYVNRHPLPPGTTLLHAEINRLFAASSFGAVEDAARGKKGADRWGMFILRIEYQQRDPHVIGGEGGTDGKAGLEGDVMLPPPPLPSTMLTFAESHLRGRPLAEACAGIPKSPPLPSGGV